MIHRNLCHLSFRTGRSTVCHIISETCEGIWKGLHTVYVKSAGGFEDWKAIAQQLETEWNFSHCLGALDGKHFVIECPKMDDQIILII